MRTNLAIDDDVLAAAKELAISERKTVGEVISALARRALRPVEPSRKTRNGLPLLEHQAGAIPVTPEIVQQLREELM